jgi:hypothetical protein
MVVVCWSLKGGVGTTVVAAALALVSSRRGERPLLLGLAGDLPAVLGVDGSGAGVADWCSLADGQVEDAVTGSSGVSPRDTDIRCTFDGDRVTVRITHLVRTEVPLVGPLLRDMTLTATATATVTMRRESG